MTTDKTTQVLAYFSAFSDKNLGLLECMFSDSVSLVDWEVSAYGIEQVLAANQKIFDSVKSLNIEVKNIAQTGNTVLAEIRVIIDDAMVVNVVDIIEFDLYNKIDKISAYKQ